MEKILMGTALVDAIVNGDKEDELDDDNYCGTFSDDLPEYSSEYKVPFDIYYISEALEYHLDKLKWELGGKVGEEPLPAEWLEEEDIEEAASAFSRIKSKALEKKRRIREREIIDQLVKLLP